MSQETALQAHDSFMSKYSPDDLTAMWIDAIGDNIRFEQNLHIEGNRAKEYWFEDAWPSKGEKEPYLVMLAMDDWESDHPLYLCLVYFIAAFKTNPEPTYLYFTTDGEGWGYKIEPGKATEVVLDWVETDIIHDNLTVYSKEK